MGWNHYFLRTSLIFRLLQRNPGLASVDRWDTFDNNYVHEPLSAGISASQTQVPFIANTRFVSLPKPVTAGFHLHLPSWKHISQDLECAVAGRRQWKLKLSPGILPLDTCARTVQAKPHMALSGVLCSRPLRISKEKVTVSPSTFTHPRQEGGKKENRFNDWGRQTGFSHKWWWLLMTVIWGLFLSQMKYSDLIFFPFCKGVF